jgi:hypothetical protein
MVGTIRDAHNESGRDENRNDCHRALFAQLTLASARGQCEWSVVPIDTRMLGLGCCVLHYADVRIMPMQLVNPLQGNGFLLNRSA